MTDPAASRPSIGQLSNLQFSSRDGSTMKFTGTLNGRDVTIQIKGQALKNSDEKDVTFMLHAFLAKSQVTKSKADESGNIYKAKLKNSLFKATITPKDQPDKMTTRQRILTATANALLDIKNAFEKLKGSIEEGHAEANSSFQEKIAAAKEQASRKATEARNSIRGLVDKAGEAVSRKSTKAEEAPAAQKPQEDLSTPIGFRKSQSQVLVNYFAPGSRRSGTLTLNNNNGLFEVDNKKGAVSAETAKQVLNFVELKMKAELDEYNQAMQNGTADASKFKAQVAENLYIVQNLKSKGFDQIFKDNKELDLRREDMLKLYTSYAILLS